MNDDPTVKINLIQGENAVSDDPRVVISTILGSCVAACIRDPDAAVGGMNHFLLPGSDQVEGAQYGAYAMELLINGLLKRGARRERLEAKLFGGARMLQGLTDIGDQNAGFARRFLRDEGIPCVAESLGGVNARRVMYWPVSGVVHQQRIDNRKAAFVRETPRAPSSLGDVEMFAA